VLSDAAWKRRFGGDPGIIGRTLLLNEESYQVVGVMGPEFNWPNQAELWVPLALPAASYSDNQLRHNEYLFCAARLRPGVTNAQANAYLALRSAQQIASEPGGYSQAAGWGMFSMPLIDFVAGDLRKPLFLLLAAVGLVLLIACANIAGLQLARASGKQREVSIQIALGVSRARLIRSALSSVFLVCKELSMPAVCPRIVVQRKLRAMHGAGVIVEPELDQRVWIGIVQPRCSQRIEGSHCRLLRIGKYPVHRLQPIHIRLVLKVPVESAVQRL